MKKMLFILLGFVLLIGCRNNDSIMFKREFENLNTKNNLIKVSLPSDNPFTYITDSALQEKIEKKEDMIVLFGYSKSNETRSIVENLLDVSKKLKIDKIYYLDISEIRDEKEVNGEEVKTLKQGTDGYNKILELGKDIFKDYKINNKVVGKRIYAGTIFKIKDNNISVTNGLSDDVDLNNYTSEEKQKSYNIIYDFLKDYIINSCSVNEGC